MGSFPLVEVPANGFAWCLGRLTMQRNMTKTRGRKKEGDRDTLSCIRGHDNSWRSDTATTGHHGVRCRARHDIVFFFSFCFYAASRRVPGGGSAYSEGHDKPAMGPYSKRLHHGKQVNGWTAVISVDIIKPLPLHKPKHLQDHRYLKEYTGHA